MLSTLETERITGTHVQFYETWDLTVQVNAKQNDMEYASVLRLTCACVSLKNTIQAFKVTQNYS